MRFLFTFLLLVAIVGQTLGQKLSYSFGKGMQNPFLKYDKFVGTKFPTDQLERLEGSPTTIKKYAGKPIWVNFWFTNCPPCIEEMPALNRLKAKYNDQVNFVSITFNDKQNVQKLINKHPFNFDHYINARKLIDQFGIDTYPMSFLIDKDGIIRSILGPIPSNDETLYESVLQKIL